LNQGTIFAPLGFSALRALSTPKTGRVSPKKICLKAAGWGGLRALNDDSRLHLSFSTLFCRPFFAQTKKGRTTIVQ